MLPHTIPLNVKKKITSLTKVLDPLPSALHFIIHCSILMQIAKSNEKEGKVKFFSPDVNHLLLGIEAGSQSLSNRERSGIYQHLTPHMPCSKDTLIRRMKKLHASKQVSGRAMAREQPVDDRPLSIRFRVFLPDRRKTVIHFFQNFFTNFLGTVHVCDNLCSEAWKK